ncbi:MAG: hypothetical protein QW472_05330 [Candidatus Aenigmatarchaeota archaeon]
MKKFLLIVLTVFFLLQSVTSAEIVCSKCLVGDCYCTVTDCDSGIVDIFYSPCSMNPSYEFTFSNGYFKWKPEVENIHYLKVLCSDGETQSECTPIVVEASREKTTTTTAETTIPAKTTTTLEMEEETEGPDYFLIVLIVMLILILLFAAYYFFFMKKKGKTYEDLYKKWGRR